MKSVREFIEKAKKEDEIKVIEGADWNLEIGAITELLAEKDGPAPLFDNIKDYPPGYRVATNLYLTLKRFCIALDLPTSTPKLDIIKRFRGIASKRLVKPIEVKTGPVMKNIRFGDAINLLEFPVPKYHERDGGRYIGTNHLVVMKDPDDGWINVGCQRCMVQDERTLSLHIAPGKHNKMIREKYFSIGKPCPVVLAFGPEPILYLSATMSVPQGVSEFDYAGTIKGEPIEVIRGEKTGLPIPAHDEIVIEGECIPPGEERRPEGPFGEWTGYYASGEAFEPIIKVKALYYRDDPILLGSPPMKPSLWKFAGYPIPITCAPSLWDAIEAAGVAGVKGVWYLEGGGERFILVIAIKQDHFGHAKQAGLCAAGTHAGGYITKIVIIVDEDIDPTNTNEVLWAVASRCNFSNQIEIIKETWGGRLDPIVTPENREKGYFTMPKMIIDACRPFSWKDKFPPVNEISHDLRTKMIEKWGKIL